VAGDRTGAGRREPGPLEIEVTVMRGPDGLDFGGPFVRGDRADRNLGLVWGDVSANETFDLVCGAKRRLADVDVSLVEEAMRTGRRLLAGCASPTGPPTRIAPACGPEHHLVRHTYVMVWLSTPGGGWRRVSSLSVVSA
jgi:Family of unknown function (DUF5990)